MLGFYLFGIPSRNRVRRIEFWHQNFLCTLVQLSTGLPKKSFCDHNGDALKVKPLLHKPVNKKIKILVNYDFKQCLSVTSLRSYENSKFYGFFAMSNFWLLNLKLKPKTQM